MKKFNRIYSEFFTSTFAGLSRTILILALAMFINRSGSMVILFMSLYTTNYLGFDLTSSGQVMACLGVGSLVGNLAGGQLLTYFDFKKIMVTTLMLSGIILVIFPFLHNFYWVCFCAFLYTLIADIFRPANFKAISAYAKKENYTQAIALNRMAMNLGFTVAPLIGGLLIAHEFKYVFWIDGLTSIASGLFLFLILMTAKVRNAVYAGNDHVGTRSPYHDGVFIFFMMICLVYATSFFQMFSTFPLCLNNDFHLSEIQIGRYMAINGLGVAIVEIFIINYLQKMGTPFKFIALGALILSITFLIMRMTTNPTWLPLVMMLFTISEIFAMPFMAALSMERAEQSRFGAYMGLYGMIWSISLILAPIVGTHILEEYGSRILWGSFTVVNLVLALIALRFRKFWN